MNKNKIKKFLSMIGTTTLVASPIIAMGGGLLSNNPIQVNSDINKATATARMIDCTEWVQGTDGSGNTTWTWTGTGEDSDKKLILLVDGSGMLSCLTSDSNAEYACNDILWQDQGENPVFLFNLDTSKINYSSLADNCFNALINIGNFTFNDNVQVISDKCFYGCYNLEKITLPKECNTIGSSAFKGILGINNKFNTIIFNNKLSTISSYAFEYCSFVSIDIPDTVTTIEGAAFRNNKKLERIKLPNKLTSISDTMFRSCTLLNDVIIPESVISIGRNAFNQCLSLSEITIPNNIVQLDQTTFWGCNSLSRINILSNSDTFKLGLNSLDTNTSTLVCFANQNLYNKYKNLDNSEDGWIDGSGFATGSGTTISLVETTDPVTNSQLTINSPTLNVEKDESQSNRVYENIASFTITNWDQTAKDFYGFSADVIGKKPNGASFEVVHTGNGLFQVNMIVNMSQAKPNQNSSFGLAIKKDGAIFNNLSTNNNAFTYTTWAEEVPPSSTNIGLIAGIAGGVVGAILLIVIIVLIAKKSKQRKVLY